MSQAIGQVLALGVGVALSPIPIVGVTLMLATPRGRRNGPAFILGWVGGLAIAGAIVLLVSGGADASRGGEPADWVNVLKLIFGLALIRLAVKELRGRSREGAGAELPRWMRGVDRFTAARAAALGLALSALNPKNLVLVVAAAAAIAQTGTGTADQAVALAVFVGVGTLGTGAPVAIYFALGERSASILDGLREWMVRNNGTVIAVICLLLAAKLIGDGISGF